MTLIAAINFETANHSKSSVCFVNASILENGAVKESYSSLVKPLANPQNFEFSSFHGIQPEDVLDAKNFSEVYHEIKKFFSTTGLVFAHNASFDKLVLTESMEAVGIPLRDMHLSFADSLSVARKSFDLPSYRLPAITNHIGLDFDPIQITKSAEMAARVVEEAFDKSDSTSLEEFLNLKRITSTTLIEYAEYLEEKRNYQPYQGLISSSDIQSELLYDPELDKDIVLTGTPDDGRTRAEIAQVAKENGFNIQGKVNKLTDILVTGDWQSGTLREGSNLSSKAAKALELKNKGQRIQIISYEDFYHLLDI